MQLLCTLRTHCRQWPRNTRYQAGCYPLLGPDFHRLDRTSLRLAHLFDHFVGAGEQHWRYFKAETFRCLQVDDKIEFGWLLDWDVRRLRAAQNLVDKVCGTPEQIREVWSVGHQTSRFDVLMRNVHRRQSRGERQCIDSIAVAK